MEEGQTLLEYFKDYIPIFQKLARGVGEVTPDNVLREKNPELKKIVYDVMFEIMDKGSEFKNTENIEAFLNEVKSGKKGIILAEHYSNFDYPMLLGMIEHSCKAGKELADRCCAMAGIKLGEEDKYISAFAEAFSRIYIYPSRAIAGITDENIRAAEMKRARAINLAAMRTMDELRNNGRVIVIFPSGTRYRPGNPETKRGVREIDSYIKTSDVMLLVSINGNCLRISENGDMTQDLIYKDEMIFTASPVLNCAEFRQEVKNSKPESKDKKQDIADKVMEILEEMHNKAESERIGRAK